MTKIELVLQHFIENIPDMEIKDRYVNLYSDYPKGYTTVFSYLHQTLNGLFNFLNTKNFSNGHYNADESRQLLYLIEGIEDLNRDLIGYGEEIIVSQEYRTIFDNVQLFLSPSGGSAIPENFPKIHVIHHESVFSIASKKIHIVNNQYLDLQLI